MTHATHAPAAHAGTQPPGSARGHEFYIPSLDGIRAAAFFLVFFHHGILNHIVPGGFGVTTFFFLSGYLITTLLRMEDQQHGTISLPNFYLRRVLRIFPPMYIAIAGAWTLVYLGIGPGQMSWGGFLAQIFHGANYYQIWYHEQGVPAGTGVLWSLAVEEHFYLVFPLFYILLRKFTKDPNKQAVVLLALCGCVLAWRILLVSWLGPLGQITLNDPFRITLATDTRIDSILFGCLLAVWHNPVLDGPPKAVRPFLVVFVLAVPLLLFSMAFNGGGIQFRETARYTLQGISLFPLFIGVIVFHNWGVIRILNWSWVRFLGTLSYSLYLVHYPILCTVRAKAEAVLGIPLHPPQHPGELLSKPVLYEAAIDAAALAISFAVALAIYYAVERPCAHLRRKLTRRRKPPAELIKSESTGN